VRIVAKSVDAVAVFRGTNRPLPYKFRFREEDGTEKEVLVERIFLVEERRIAGIRTLLYDCQSAVDGVQRRYQLKYLIQDCRWELYKI
jgi:hypothetical protein